MMIKNIYLKIDISYHIFINLLVNHTKNNFVKYRQFDLIFALVRTAILFTIISNFFCSIIYRECILKNGKWKAKAKIITIPIKKNYKNDCKSIKEIFLKMKKLRKEIVLTLEIKYVK